MPLTLQGYHYSVYTRIARIVLHEKGLGYDYTEVDPFADPPDPSRHPFGRVPVLIHDDLTIYETVAITRYLDATFPSPGLIPIAPLAQARMAQVISIIDNYAYWPLVRQVFSHRVFRPLEGEPADQAEIAAGLDRAKPVLTALETIAAERHVLSPDTTTLACAHLLPMVDYFVRAPEGAQMLGTFPALSQWWAAAQHRAAFVATDPGLDRLSPPQPSP